MPVFFPDVDGTITINSTVIVGGTPGLFLYDNGGVVGETAGGGGGVTIDITAITGGVTARLLYDNSATVGECLLRYSAANLFLGDVDAASPVAQTLSPQNVATGTSNTAGTDFTIAGSKGTGTGEGGSIILKTAPKGGSGSSQNALSTTMEMETNGRLIFTNATSSVFMVGPNGGNATFTGIANVAIGDYTLTSLTSGFGNLAIGVGSLFQLTSGDKNTAVGKDAGIGITTGSENFALGTAALQSLQTGDANVGIGTHAGQGNVSSDNNIAIGGYALNGATGASNVAIGVSAGITLTSDGSNTLIGYASGSTMASGTLNVIIGANAGRDITDGDGNTLIGGWEGPSASMSSVIAFSDGFANLRLDYSYTNANTWTTDKAICITPVAVAALPAAGIMGRRHFVTDATLTVFASVVVGLGGNPVPVYDDGTNWRIG